MLLAVPQFTASDPTLFDGAAPESQGRIVVIQDEVYAALPSDDGVRIEQRTRTDGRWGEPAVLHVAGAGLVAMSPALDDSAQHLYFETNLRSPGIEGRDDSDIWVMDRVGNGWGVPRPLGPPFDSPANEHAPTVSGETICFNSTRPGGMGRNDIYCGLLEGQPHLISAVSSSAQDAGPWLAGSAGILLFASNREGGEGGWDLYISTRTADGWSAPRNLGAPINTAADELWPFWAASRLYFKRVSPTAAAYYSAELSL